MKKTFLGLVLLFAAFGCAQSPSTNPDDALEAIVRYEIAKHDFPVYFVRINDSDPSDAFIARFADIPGVMKYSKGKGGPPNYELADPDTGKKGMAIIASQVLFEEGGKATAIGNYYIASLAAEGFNYTLKWQEGKWVVVDAKRTWIS